ncbi:MAG: hypothetical protein M1133_04690 [Armatimonadetes bacterium]|nr:hypothetical protein [Armatimonadota bacterium]
MIFCLALTTALPSLAQVGVNPAAPTEAPDAVRPQISCKTDELVPVSIKAPVYESYGSLIRASGGVVFTKGNERLTFSDGEYDVNALTGRMRNVTFTTCPSARPDYHLTAREVTLLPHNKLRARQASLYLGRLKVLTLPAIKLRVGGRSSSAAVFPRPGFDKRDGFTLSQDLRVIDEDNWRANADLRLTTLHGIQGRIETYHAFNGDLGDLPGRYLSYDSLRSRAMSLPRELADGCTPQDLRNNDAATLRGFARISLRQRTYDIRNEGLVVYRQPELGLTYLGRQISLTHTQLDPRLEIYPEITTSWGRFKETPGLGEFTNRTSVNLSAAVNLLPLGPSTTVQPIISHVFSAYGTGDNYHATAYAIDASHIWPNGAYSSLRYIKRNQFGVTPFIFDSVEIFREFQFAGQMPLSKKYVTGIVMNYNSDVGSLYEWEALFGWRSDCLATWVRWNQRLKRLAFDVTLINL